MLIPGILAVSSTNVAHSIPEEFSYSPDSSERPRGVRHNPETNKSEKAPPGTWQWIVLLLFMGAIIYIIRKFGGKGNPPSGGGPARPVSPPPARQSVQPPVARFFAPRAGETAAEQIRLAPDVGMPNLYTVRDQIVGMIEHGIFPKMAELFSKNDLYDFYILFAAHEAIEKWHKVVARNGAAATSYTNRDALFSYSPGAPFNGRLPSPFLEEIVTAEFPDQRAIRNLRPAVLDWIRETTERTVYEITAALSSEKVKAQLINHYVPTNSPRHLDLLTSEAIKKWNRRDQNTMFVDITQETPAGELSAPFIRHFVGRVVPVILENLRLSWRRVPEAVKGAFAPLAGEDREPDLFVDLVMALGEGESLEEIFKRDDNVWSLPVRTETIFYNGQNLDLLMNTIVRENGELAHYPKLLEKLAKLRIDALVNTQGQGGGLQGSGSSGEEITRASDPQEEITSSDEDGAAGDEASYQSIEDEDASLFSSLFMVGAETFPVADFAYVY